MKVIDFINALSRLSEEELQLPVRVYADHGQSAMPAHEAGVEYLDSEDYMADLVCDDADLEESFKVFLISN